MKNFRVTAILATAGLTLFGSARAADLYVIANPSVELAENQIHDVFVGNKQIVRGAKIVPMDNATLQADFLEKVLKLDGHKYNLIWTKKGFREGLNPPSVKSSDAEVVSAVKSTPGAIGYVANLPAGVQLIKKY